MLEDSERKAAAKIEQLTGEASRLREEADQYAKQRETLRRETRMVEERRQRVLESLRDFAAQLQDALVEPAESSAREEMLEEALVVEACR
jgi:hypothetical protein